MATSPAELTPDAHAFLIERHLGTLSTLRGDGSLHVCAVGFTWDPDARVLRVITGDGSQKVRNVERSGRAAIGQVDGGRWLSLEGPARVTRDPDAVGRSSARSQVPRDNPRRVAIEIGVERVLGRA